MRSIRTMEEANEVTAVRLTEKRRFAKVGDLFRLSPQADVFYLWHEFEQWHRLCHSVRPKLRQERRVSPDARRLFGFRSQPSR